ncbi:ABC transporter permease [Microbacterium sp.]|uniref:ABC transporter permease n=1 Tax=Microbacterium sp. TaxID=51671 RepID=UPI0026087ED8|nr:ABC transporter permease [Microbacterium sp.]
MTSISRQFTTLLRTEVLLFLREPTALFFSLAFPLILLLFVGSIGATDEVDDGIRFIDTYMASMVAVTAANVGIMGLSIHVAENRARGALKRYRLSPMSPGIFFGAQFATALVTVIVSLIGLIVVTLALYGLSIDANWPLFLATALLSLYVAVSWGLFLGGLRLPLRSVQVISAAVFFLMFFSSGAALPRESFPEWLQAIVAWNPLAVANDLLMSSYAAYGVVEIARIAALVISTLIVNAITSVTFDWEGRNS